MRTKRYLSSISYLANKFCSRVSDGICTLKMGQTRTSQDAQKSAKYYLRILFFSYNEIHHAFAMLYISLCINFVWTLYKTTIAFWETQSIYAHKQIKFKYFYSYIFLLYIYVNIEVKIYRTYTLYYIIIYAYTFLFIYINIEKKNI